MNGGEAKVVGNRARLGGKYQICLHALCFLARK